MNSLSELREKIIKFYSSADVYILPILKFLLAFALFFAINVNYGYLEILNNMFIVVVLAVACALLPLGGMVAIGMILIVLHCFGIGMELGAIALCIYLLLFILIMRFVSKDSLAVLLMPFAFQFHVSAAVPVTLGMLGKASSALTMVCSLIACFFLKGLPQIAQLKQEGELTSLELLNSIMETVIGNTELILYAIVCVAVVLIVYLIRKLCTTYGWLISILIGTAVYMALLMCGARVLEIELDMFWHVAGSCISIVITLIVAFFKFNADYKGSRYIQFEDDDYYYYVKAIPKVKCSSRDEEEEDFFEPDEEEESFPREKGKKNFTVDTNTKVFRK